MDERWTGIERKIIYDSFYRYFQKRRNNYTLTFSFVDTCCIAWVAVDRWKLSYDVIARGIGPVDSGDYSSFPLCFLSLCFGYFQRKSDSVCSR